MNYNLVILAGNVTQDLRISTSQSGKVFADFSLANTRYLKDGQKETTYIPIKCFGKVAETVQQNVHRGDGLLVEGELVMEQFESKYNGKMCNILKVYAKKIMLSGGLQQPQQPPQGQYQQQPQQPPQGQYQQPQYQQAQPQYQQQAQQPPQGQGPYQQGGTPYPQYKSNDQSDMPF